jgi:glycosyltransferase involved in cell wall biosynthesis
MNIRVLLVSTDVVGQAMAGPGIRAWELARALAPRFEVTLAVPGTSDRDPAGFRLLSYAWGQPGALRAALAAADVLDGQGCVFEAHPELLATGLPLAIDLYDPLLIEGLDLYASADLATAEARHARYQALTDAQLRRGDFFFCATEAQRDYWLGALTAAGRITPALARAADRDLRMLIDLVPSGIPVDPPAPGAPALRGVHPAIGRDDVLFLWAGGLWDWFDPLVLVRAAAAVAADCPRLRIGFFAGARPNPLGEPFTTRKRAEAQALAAELGVFGRSVIFLDAWVPYDARGAYLAEADAGVSAHLPGVETHFAFRTRMLDYVWARLPVICTAGDSLGEAYARAGAGLLVPPHDPEAWATALRRLYADAGLRAACRAAADRLADQLTWPEVARPLAAFCEAPRRSPAALPIIDQRITAFEQVLAQREAQIADLSARAAWLEGQARAARRALDAVANGRVMRILRHFGRK